MNTDTLKLVLKNRTQGKKVFGDILKTYPIGELFNHPTISAVGRILEGCRGVAGENVGSERGAKRSVKFWVKQG